MIMLLPIFNINQHVYAKDKGFLAFASVDLVNLQDV